MRNVMKPVKSNILIHVFLVSTTYILIKQVGHFLYSEKDNQKSIFRIIKISNYYLLSLPKLLNTYKHICTYQRANHMSFEGCGGYSQAFILIVKLGLFLTILNYKTSKTEQPEGKWKGKVSFLPQLGRVGARNNCIVPHYCLFKPALWNHSSLLLNEM